MRQIINGTAYDTETAELVKQVQFDPEGEQVNRLYRTRHGAFFFHPRYVSTVVDPDNWEEKHQVLNEDKLIPCTDERAREWLEKYDQGLVEQYFGEVPEAGSGEKRFTLRMPDNLVRRIETKAGEIPLTRYINRCLERCVAEGDGVDTAKERYVDAIALPEVSKKVMKRSHQRDGVVAGGTQLSSGAKQATVAFPSPIFDKLKLAADKNGVSLSEMVRQCVDTAFSGR